MALFHIQDQQLKAVDLTTFEEQQIKERSGLQAMLIKNISVLGDDLFVICEEYGNFKESSRRIDLLCLDKDRKLVVVEIKRTEDGGHAELQAIRYAAMISSMNLDEVIAAHAEMMKKSRAASMAHEEFIGAARQKIYEFCGVVEGEECELSEDLRILLVSSKFSTEITTTVLWLNRQGLDISCIRLIPYQHLDESIFIDATKIIPLPETEQYEIKIRSREIETRNKAREKDAGNSSLWRLFIDKSNTLNKLFDGRLPNTSDYIAARAVKNMVYYRCFSKATFVRVDIYLGAARGKELIYHALESNRVAIEQELGANLKWFAEDKIEWNSPVIEMNDTSDEHKAQWMAQSLNRLYEATKAYL